MRLIQLREACGIISQALRSHIHSHVKCYDLGEPTCCPGSPTVIRSSPTAMYTVFLHCCIKAVTERLTFPKLNTLKGVCIGKTYACTARWPQRPVARPAHTSQRLLGILQAGYQPPQASQTRLRHAAHAQAQPGDCDGEGDQPDCPGLPRAQRRAGGAAHVHLCPPKLHQQRQRLRGPRIRAPHVQHGAGALARHAGHADGLAARLGALAHASRVRQVSCNYQSIWTMPWLR